jgi:3-keto-L-gulonate-6-phosphate decarboxylase
VNLDNLSYPIVQLSLDLISLDEALATAAVGVAAGVDWLEAGTPLLLAHGLRAVEALRARFPDHPIVADLKTMDGGYLEAEMMAKAGANLVVVMGRAHEATIRRVVDAGRDFGIKVMGDNLAADDRIACAKWMERLGVDFIVHHIGFDERARSQSARRTGSSRGSSIDTSAGGGRIVHPAGDRVPAAWCSARRRRSAARDRRYRVQARGRRSSRYAAEDLRRDPRSARSGALTRFLQRHPIRVGFSRSAIVASWPSHRSIPRQGSRSGRTTS